MSTLTSHASLCSLWISRSVSVSCVSALSVGLFPSEAGFHAPIYAWESALLLIELLCEVVDKNSGDLSLLPILTEISVRVRYKLQNLLKKEPVKSYARTCSEERCKMLATGSLACLVACIAMFAASEMLNYTKNVNTAYIKDTDLVILGQVKYSRPCYREGHSVSRSRLVVLAFGLIVCGSASRSASGAPPNAVVK